MSLPPCQPATEEKVEESNRPDETKSAAEGQAPGVEKEQPKKEAEEVNKEQKATGDDKGAADEGLTSIFQSPLRLVRKNKMKLVVCHVTLLDGTDFPCEVEVRPGTDPRAHACALMHTRTDTPTYTG